MAYEMEQGDFMVPKNHEQENRIGFIRKVYGILTAQFCLTTLITGIIVAVESIQEWLFINWPFLLVCVLINFSVLIALLCFRKISREYPKNLILLTIFTISESLLVGNFAAFFDPLTVLMAAVLTLGVTIGVTVYAVFTKSEFTTLRGIMSGLFLGLILYIIFFAVFLQTRLVGLMICLVFIIIYTIFIVIDTQRIVGGKRWQLSYDDYIIGSLCLYIDIIGLFIYMLRLLGRK